MILKILKKLFIQKKGFKEIFKNCISEQFVNDFKEILKGIFIHKFILKENI